MSDRSLPEMVPAAPTFKEPDNGGRAFRPASVPSVTVGGFLGARIDAISARTVGILYKQCVAAGMLDQIDPTRPSPGRRLPFNPLHPTCTPQMFWDSDWGKTIETAAYCLSRARNEDLESAIDRIVDAYCALQATDGYLSSWYLRIQPGLRWTNLRDCHELYCAGHLIEGAVAYWQATGKRKLMDALARFADHIGERFGSGSGQERGYCGHEEVELALVKLARATGENRYMEFARYFIDERGQRPPFFEEEARRRGEEPSDFVFNDGEYNQSHQPVRDQRHVVGHAVRAMYLYSGMADIAAEYRDESLLPALESLWSELTEKRLYLTGGMGPSARNEGFTEPYDLPNESAYAETCAAVGLVFWASRMLGVEPDSRYGDVMERALYNGALAGVSLAGDRFFYDNPLESRGSHHRWQWHECPCCPPNIARLIASVGSYMYAESHGAVAVHLYGESLARLSYGHGRVRLQQRTRFPWHGWVSIAVDPSDAPARFALMLRIPGWSAGVKIAVNDAPFDPPVARGYARIERLWSAGDRVDIDLGMRTQRVYANAHVRADAGRVALLRGPLVYCIEGADNGPELHRFRLPDDAAIEEAFDEKLLGGIVPLTIGALQDGNISNNLYGSAKPRTQSVSLKAVPYCLWDNREPGEMMVWIRR